MRQLAFRLWAASGTEGQGQASGALQGVHSGQPLPLGPPFLALPVNLQLCRVSISSVTSVLRCTKFQSVCLGTEEVGGGEIRAVGVAVKNRQVWLHLSPERSWCQP